MPAATHRQPRPDLERACGRIRLDVACRDGSSVIADLHQEGCGRLLFPARAPTAPLEAVVVNVGGGLTGGDRFDVAAWVRRGASAVLTTQASEKIYRAGRGKATTRVRLSVADEAALAWLPQETILFEGSVLARRLDIELSPQATFTAVEAVVLGRAAMGERLSSARLSDSWRLHRGGRLVFAEEMACDGAWGRAFGAAAALGADAAAFATLLHCSPGGADRLDGLRGMFARRGIDAGASVVDGVLVARMLASEALRLRRALTDAVSLLTDRPPPRVWAI
jgi:urease accessory protein